ncbi:MAG: helix-turn-helix transcriptional regulator [Nitrospirae bacterium]|nr:helix-turn-helix transcriptional regulator [Nitrospirota bacterium]
MSTARATSGRCNRLTVGFITVSQTRREEQQTLKLAAKLREKNGLAQQQMAKFVGTSQQAVSRIIGRGCMLLAGVGCLSSVLLRWLYRPMLPCFLSARVS